jgi:hypothetical protein
MTLSYSVGLTLGSAMAYGLNDLLGPPTGLTCNETSSNNTISIYTSSSGQH